MKLLGIRDYFKKIFKNKEFADQVKVLNEADETKHVLLTVTDYNIDGDSFSAAIEQLEIKTSAAGGGEVVIDCGSVA